jgi:hypothetical protein
VQAKQFFLCRNDVQAIAFLGKGSYAPDGKTCTIYIFHLILTWLMHFFLWIYCLIIFNDIPYNIPCPCVSIRFNLAAYGFQDECSNYRESNKLLCPLLFNFPLSTSIHLLGISLCSPLLNNLFKVDMILSSGKC